MPKLLASKRALQPSSTLYENIFGTEQDRLASSIKQRRFNEEIKKAGLRPFELEDMAGMSPAMGVTKYLKSAGIPDRLGRMIGTETFKNKMSDLGMGEVGARFAARYPRVAAHIKAGLVPPGQMEGNAEVQGRAFIGHGFKYGNERTVPVALSKAADNLDSTMAHEATHVAQRLGMGERMEPAYRKAEGILGYDLNPFEMSARHAANRYALPGGRALSPISAKGVTEAMADLPRNKKVKEYLLSIFDR